MDSIVVSPLAVLLVFKIAVTLALVVTPFLVLPAARVETLSGFEGASAPLLRLYAVAILALLVGYGGGLIAALDGVFPWGVVAMGIVSNAGAALTMMVTGYAAQKPAPAILFGAIGAGLIAAALAPGLAIAPL